MIKESITYTDYNDEVRTEDFWFHLDKADMVRITATYGDPSIYFKKVIAANDNKEIFRIFEELIMMSIGQKTEDGRKFVRNEEIRSDFRDTPAFGELLLTLGSDEAHAARFMAGLLPKGMGGLETVELPPDTSTNDAEAKTEPRLVEHGPVDGNSKWTDFSEEQLLTMSQQNFDYLLNKIPGPKPALLLGIGIKRKQR